MKGQYAYTAVRAESLKVVVSKKRLQEEIQYNRIERIWRGLGRPGAPSPFFRFSHPPPIRIVAPLAALGRSTLSLSPHSEATSNIQLLLLSPIGGSGDITTTVFASVSTITTTLPAFLSSDSFLSSSHSSTLCSLFLQILTHWNIEGTAYQSSLIPLPTSLTTQRRSSGWSFVTPLTYIVGPCRLRS